MQTNRISAGAIIIQNNKILLVRYTSPDKQDLLVGPGGGIQNTESLSDAIIREVYEETGLHVSVGKMLFVEDLLYPTQRIIKFWFLCTVTGGTLTQSTPEAQIEGISEVDWYSKEQLKNQLVFPTPIIETDWNNFAQETWQAFYIAPKLVSGNP